MSNPAEPTGPQPGDVPPPPPPTQPQYSQPQYPTGEPYPPQAGQPYQAYQYGTQPTAPAQYAPREPSGFSALFDMSFRRYATPTIAKLVYVFVLILALLTVLSGLISGIGVMAAALGPYGNAVGVLMGLVIIIAAFVGATLMLATYRLILEFFVVQFNIAGHVRQIAENQPKSS